MPEQRKSLTIIPNRLDKAIGQARQLEGAYFDNRMRDLDSRTLRLEVLRLELAQIVDSRAEAKRFVNLAISGDEQPRLWIDLTSYVVMAPSARQYRFVRDRQDNSEVLFETRDRAEMVETITQFIAHRVVERERMLEPNVMFAPRGNQKYSSTSLVLAWLSGLLLGIIGLFAFGIWYGG